MDKGLHGKDLITLGDLTAAQVRDIIGLARRMKSGRYARRPLAGKTVVLYFEKPSLRTRLSFEIAVTQLGGSAVYVNSDTTHSRRGEPLKDTARVISRYAHGVVYRATRHRDILEMAGYAGAPVINALSEFSHPCQGLADYLIIVEKKGARRGLRLAYVGDGNNVAHSLLYICSKMGIDITVACPKGFEPDAAVVKRAGRCAAKSGAKIRSVRNPEDAVRGADIVYTDVWTSMGQEREAARRRRAFKGCKVDRRLMALAAPDAVFMHDLPAHRGEEVDDDVIEGPQSVVFDQAENRLHVQKAILALIIGNAETKTQR